MARCSPRRPTRGASCASSPTARRDQNVLYSPDGKWLAYVSDQSGREEIYLVAADGSGAAKPVTDLDALKQSFLWSPDSKTLAFTTSDDKLYTISLEGKDLKELVASKYGRIDRPAWSPDGKWIAFARPDVTRSSDIYLIPAAGGEAKKVSFDSADESQPPVLVGRQEALLRPRRGRVGAPADAPGRTLLHAAGAARQGPRRSGSRSDDEADGAGPGGGPPGPAARETHRRPSRRSTGPA